MPTSIIALVTPVLAVIAAIFGLIGFLVGAKRGLMKQTLAICLIFLAIFISMAVVAAVAAPIGAELWPMVKDMLPAEALQAIESSPSLEAFASALPTALAAPFLFCVAFFALLIVLKIVYAIVAHIKVFKKENFKNPKVSTWTGGALGLVTACVIFVCLLMPLTGYANFAADTLSSLPESEADAPEMLYKPVAGTLSLVLPELSAEDGAEADEEGEDIFAALAEINATYVTPVAKSPVFSAVSACGGNGLFHALTSTKINDTRVDILGEIAGMAEAVLKLEPMLGVEIKDFGPEQANALRSVVDDVDASNILKNIFSEVLSAAATTWQKGESFAGIAPLVTEETAPTLKPILENLVNVLATSTPENIAGDLYTIADVFGVLAKNQTFALLGGQMETTQLIDALTKEGMLSDVLVAFKSNEHMEELIPTVINMGMAVLGDAMGLPENDEAVYEDLMTKVTDSVNETLATVPAEERTETIAANLQSTAADYGITFSDNIAQFYAESIANDFTPGVVYTEAEVIGYFAEVAAYLAEQGENVPVSATLTEGDGLLMLGTVLLDTNNGKSNGGSRVSFTRPEKAPEVSEEDKNTTSMLSGGKPLEHSLVTKESLKMDTEIVKALTKEEVKADGEKIAESLSTITKILEILTPAEPDEPDDSENPEKPEQSTPSLGLDSIGALNEAGLGAALGNLASTSLLKDAAPQLLVGALQAGGVVLPKAETEEIINTIKQDNANNNNGNGGESGESGESGNTGSSSANSVIESLVNSTAHIAEMMNHIQQDELSEDELVATLDKLFKELTPSSAGVVKNIAQPSLISKYAPGLPADNVAALCKLIGSIFETIAESDAAEYSAESALMSDLLQMMMRAKDSAADRLFTDPATGEKGKMNITADKFLAKIIGSELIPAAVKNAGLGEDPFNVSEMLSEEDVAEFVDAANLMMANNADMRANASRVIDVATLVGLKLSYSQTTHTFTVVD